MTCNVINEHSHMCTCTFVKLQQASKLRKKHDSAMLLLSLYIDIYYVMTY